MLFFWFTDMKPSNDVRERFLRGTVMPVDWDSSGSVTRIGLTGTDGKRYLLSRQEVGEELFEHMGQTVEARGVVTEDGSGDLVFVVNQYETVYCLRVERP